MSYESVTRDLYDYPWWFVPSLLAGCFTYLVEAWPESVDSGFGAVLLPSS